MARVTGLTEGGRLTEEQRRILDNPRVRRVAAILADERVVGRILALHESARTAAEAAVACGCEVGAIANSLIFRCDDRPLLILTSGAHRVDVKKVQHQLGRGRLHRADPDYVLQVTGQVIGGVAPVGHPDHIETIVDTALADHARVWADAGHPHALFPTTFEELVRITSGTPMDVA
ncbi:YbaK/EbsC family protein [uncultured Bifidobacterium sp.]|uniref:YbaK/EbsC family protein n=1 Tax=uncultured Bifidobacterium sp. TaxID=165187 RepID=UPI0028DD02C2|nr:YbaK/EbsC family protein [uncultured Bifidobacterium sp.]